ncbi:MAG TPA: M15 family metallopeptidase [Chthoniobacterales bacterium]|jgi:D-alanyl-D-alanine dipeptidase
MIRSILAVLIFTATTAWAQKSILEIDDLQWVNIRSVAPTIAIELRYGSSNNVAHRRLYPLNMQPMIRAGVAQKLIEAQSLLRRRQYGLKIWDAYRPREVHTQLWQFAPHNNYVADPTEAIGSMHSWGVAVDATLVDDWGRPVSMPTDFDDFTPAAMLHYTGNDRLVRFHLYLLQSAMARAGFYGLRTEWWHFTTSDWRRYVPAELANLTNPVALSQ